MKILAVADVESRYYYEYYTPGKLDEFDLILGCGDLRREYLEFLATMSRCPVLYVRGNHNVDYLKRPPEGCVCVDGGLYVHEGVRILGLGGSFRYRAGEDMYTEAQMRRRIARARPALWKHRGFDILLTHAPMYGLNDLDNLAHRGFECFRGLLDVYAPKYFLHGHVHRTYGINIPQKCEYGGTTVINAYEHCVFEY